MKLSKIVLFFILQISIFSCAIVTTKIDEFDIMLSKLSDYNLPTYSQFIETSEFKEIKKEFYDLPKDLQTETNLLETIQQKIKINFTYYPDPENTDIWQNPIETVNRHGGDCEDFAIFLIYVYYRITNKTNIFLQIYETTGTKCHAVILHKNNKYLTIGTETKLNYTLTFEQSIKLAEYEK